MSLGFAVNADKLVPLAGPMLQEVIEGAQLAGGGLGGGSPKARAMNNFKQMGIALHTYASSYDKLPPAVLTSPDGKPLFSWRVALLPYVEQDNLYKQLKLDEPWNSPHNKKVLDSTAMPLVKPIVTG